MVYRLASEPPAVMMFWVHLVTNVCGAGQMYHDGTFNRRLTPKTFNQAGDTLNVERALRGSLCPITACN
jgi:hypothetical protein